MTVAEFDNAMDSLTSVRRSLVNRYLGGSDVSAELAQMERYRRDFQHLPGKARIRVLSEPSGDRVRFDLRYEISELERDVTLARDGEEALLEKIARADAAEFSAGAEPFRDVVRVLAEHLSLKSPYYLFVTDRDGTVNNYCGRYRSSVQPAYAAVFLTRFARACSRRSILLTSAPLAGIGLLDVSVSPDGAFVMAGSKGREYVDEGGTSGNMPITSEDQNLLDRLNKSIETVLARPKYAIFGRIGSGFQRKFGQTTIARQDIAGSVPPARSEDLLAVVRSIVAELDREGTRLTIEDTGTDVEIMLNFGPSAGFDKGAGIAFLGSELGLDLSGTDVLVCGDTHSDVAMVRALRDRGANTTTVFVATEERLKRDVRQADPDAIFVRSPDVLVCALNLCSSTCSARQRA